MIDVANMAAIDVHVHAEVSASGHPSLPDHLREGAAAYFAAGHRGPTVPEIAAYYRERHMAAVVFTVDAESATGHPAISNEEIAVSAAEHPDVALVGLGESSEHALDLISEIVRGAACPVVAILNTDDPAYVHEAAKRGVFAYIVDTTPDELQSAIDITLQRFTEYHNLRGAFGRRAVIEQAKGILMARHAIDADRAFDMLRDHSQHNGHKLADVAGAIVDSHLLLLPSPAAEH